MTDTQVSGEAATIEPTDTAPEAVFSSPETGAADQPQERNYEAEARYMGWVPEAEFKGDKKPAKFLEAKEFVERGETVLPFVQRENKRLKDEIAKRDKDFEDRIGKLTKATEATLKKQREDHDRQLADLNAKRDAAVQSGDLGQFKALDRQITDHKANAPEVEDIKPVGTTTDPIAAARTAEATWADSNKDWYGKDPVMTGFAQYHSQQIARADLSMEENLRLTLEAVRQQFPMKFGKAGANAHAPVDSGGDPKAPSTGSKSPTFDKLPAEAKAFARAAKERGDWKGSLEEWAKDYNS